MEKGRVAGGEPWPSPTVARVVHHMTLEDGPKQEGVYKPAQVTPSPTIARAQWAREERPEAARGIHLLRTGPDVQDLDVESGAEDPTVRALSRVAQELSVRDPRGRRPHHHDVN